MKSLAVLLALASAAAVSAEPTAEELAKSLEKTWQPWKDCSPGSWIQMRSTSKNSGQSTTTEFRQTLVSRDEKGCKIETRTVKRTVDEQGAENIELGEPNVSTTDASPGMSYKDVKEFDKEQVQVGDRKLDCRVLEATAVYQYPQAAGAKAEMTWKIKMWVSDQVKDMGGVVKSETDAENQNALGGMWSSDMKLIETGKELKVGATTLTCSVLQYGSSSGKEENVSSGEIWVSSDSPMGWVKMKSHMKMNGNGMKLEMDSEVEISDMVIVKPKED